MKISKATSEEKTAYSRIRNGSLYGYLALGDIKLAIESLPNDPAYRYEVFAPDGCLFDEDLTSMLGETLKEIRQRVFESSIDKIEDSCPY